MTYRFLGWDVTRPNIASPGELFQRRVVGLILSDRHYRKARGKFGMETTCYRVRIVHYNHHREPFSRLPVGAFRVVLQFCAAEFRLCKGGGGEEHRLVLPSEEC